MACCMYCEEGRELALCQEHGINAEVYIDADDNLALQADDGYTMVGSSTAIYFCPMCGRKLRKQVE